MLLLDDGALVYSATDMADAAVCEFALLRTLDARLGRIDPLERVVDATRARAGVLGDLHERRVLAEYLAHHGTFDPETGRGVVEIERPRRATRDTLVAKHAETLAALHAGADVVYQAGFFDGSFGGWADFLVREGRHAGDRPRYAVYDTKLARREKPTALLQLAAYADQLLAAGIDVADEVHLILGNRATTSHRLADLLPVYRERRWRLEDLLFGHQATVEPVEWGDPRYRACGRCDVCVPELEERRDVLLVAGVRGTQRARLEVVGVHTIEDLAASTGPVPGIGADTLGRLREQALLQSRQDGADDGIAFTMFRPETIAALPAPSPGDIFFDFEGDPLWSAGEVGPDGQAATWGLEYLFGVIEAPVEGEPTPRFVPFWAHDRAAEKAALLAFLEYVRVRRLQHPDLHIYHYAPYERTALLRLAGRHGVGEVAIDELLSAGVLVDLYATVRASVRTGQRSYSLKKLEPLYMDVGRTGEVTTAGDSINEYAAACALRDAGDLDGWQAKIDEIGRYNAYDCLSTLGLRDWLLEQAAAAGVLPGRAAVVVETGDDAAAPERDVLVARLLAFADDPAGFVDEHRTADQQAIALLAASLGYHWREHKPFWWAHYDRLVADPAEWTDARSTFVAERVEVLTDWYVPAGARAFRRDLRLVGRLEPGSELRAGSRCFALYEQPGPVFAQVSDANSRGWTVNATVVSVEAEGVGVDARDVLVVVDQLKQKDAQHDFLPMGLGPSEPPSTAIIADALHRLGEQVADGLPDLPPQPALDLVRRVPPRTRSGGPLPTPGAGPEAMVDAITAALLDLDGSYLAVQGPPGTGKTYTGSRVIARLVALGWKVGVVAQSHAVVENLLRTILEAGVPAQVVAKKPRGKDADPEIGWLQPKDTRAFTDFYGRQGAGFVVGGTVWDFANAGRIPAGGFDLLVVDEAGQFSLANTFAVSAAARNLLLLGDPQQLPQVSQGHHPEPVDASALGWLADGHDTLPVELGYFLAHTWRMHPALCARVSHLSYDGRLQSVARAARRSLDGVPPGVRAVLVEHEGNAVSSVQEADEIVTQVRGLVGRRWRDPDAGVDRPLGPSDVLVVAAYNAQVWTVLRSLERAGLPDVRVGTVDKFQGQEAPVVIVSLAASSPEDVPRGMEFLLNRNRLNVAVSRGQWAALVVRSVGLTDYLPTTPAQLAELGAFLGLTDDAAR